MKETKTFKLNLPDGSDIVEVEKLNENFEKLDTLAEVIPVKQVKNDVLEITESVVMPYIRIINNNSTEASVVDEESEEVIIIESGKDYVINIDGSEKITMRYASTLPLTYEYFVSLSENSDPHTVNYRITETESESYAKAYRLQSKSSDSEEWVDVLGSSEINIPKDLVVESGSVKECTVDGQPEGFKKGDRYIDLVIANKENTHIYIAVNDLVDNKAEGISYSNVNSKLESENVQDAIDEIAENVNSAEQNISNLDNKIDVVKTECIDFANSIIARIDINSDLKVIGLDADFENNSFTKIGGCLDKETIFGSIGRVNLSDDGEVLARYGDDNYKEDGSNGQVMVEIPRIYYMVEPIKLGEADCADGQSLMHGKYYISLEPRPGMKLHPAFRKANSDKVYVSAFEGYVSDGKLNSIGDVLPTVSATRMTFEGYAKARGEGWHILDADINALVQLLVVIDIGSFNMQTHIGQGVTNSNNTGRFYTGSTIGNTTGSAISTKGTDGIEQTAADKTSVNWRGIENIYGNVWKVVIGMNVFGDGSQAGGQIYLCDDTNYSETRISDNYHPTNLYSPNSNNYIKYFGYNEDYDYLMCPTAVGGDSAKPIGDFSYSTAGLNGNRIALVGGRWSLSSQNGGFCLRVADGAYNFSDTNGARSVYFR